jgi:hypothetical protein
MSQLENAKKDEECKTDRPSGDYDNYQKFKTQPPKSNALTRARDL